MVEKRILVIFSAPPFAGFQGREALDAVLAASAYEQQLSLLFLDDGLWQLVKGQDPLQGRSKDYLSTFRALPLYEVEDIYVCGEALAKRGLSAADLSLEAKVLDSQGMAELLAQQQCIYRF
ncbi:sulfurtransferase complex subunit TusC [Gallaecimonas kandeliae]|uniref:sulfurtransferase complex subunit TusC n=1 Tax=Gallaecimonas kandeliae TaxID=3029055 RepID=UPI0026480C91|nr:sulfurtransferase complex subunit TusC [Gallaecimonas kandeliae]WKE67269.1 sulfurtransferase complex subunit TusC [Gallaecimonas kandeliae]